MRIAIVGATGFAGDHLTTEARDRGHQVVAVSRTGAPDGRPGVTARPGSVDDAALVDALAAESDVLALAVPALWPDGRRLADLVPGLLAAVERHGTRLGVVGGAGSLSTEPGGPALYDSVPMPEQVLAGSKAQGQVLAALRADAGGADWFYLSPAGGFGARNPGERTGRYRTGGDVLVTDDDGVSFVSGADYAVAFLDEIETPKHSRDRFTVAY